MSLSTFNKRSQEPQKNVKKKNLVKRKYTWLRLLVVRACRKVPFALRERLTEELAYMEKLNVVKKIDKPTNWVSSLMIVQKKMVH